MPDNLLAPFGALPPAKHLSAWRRSLLNGLCAAACSLGLLVIVPSVWLTVQVQLWGLAAVDLLALSTVLFLHFRRSMPYRYRAMLFIAVLYLIAVALLYTLGAMTQIYLLAVPVLCTVLIGRRAAVLAILGCSATLFVAGYFFGIAQGTPIDTSRPLLHWTILSINFLLVASLLVVSCAYLLHGLESQIDLLQARESALRESVAAQKAAEESNEQKSEFLAMISHEVRTPLGGVIGMLRLAQKDASLAPDTRNKLRISHANAEGLLHIINDILDYSRLEAGKMPFESIDFDLPALLNDVVLLLADRAETKGISLVAELARDLPQWWQGDPVRLRQVVMNLVGNGVKFTERGEVRLTAAAAPGGGIVLSVQDTGIGIESKELDRLFQKFEQANAATSRKFGGAGLGLAICKNIVDAMGGTIDVRSAPGAGSEFTVFLPLQPGQQAVQPAIARRTPHAARLEILCAEDGGTNQIILRELLADMGHRVTIAEDGQAALEQLAQRDFDLVIMDSRMPRMDGIAALRQLRAGSGGVRNRAVPVVALTANAADDERQRFMAAGADGFLPKPINEENLHAEIGRQLERMARSGRPTLPELDAMFAPDDKARRRDIAYVAARAAFQHEGPRLLAAIREALANDDAAAVSLNAHSLLGGAGYFGAGALRELCGRIERLADGGQLQATAPLVAALEAALAETLAELNTAAQAVPA
ncbi:MAG: histidine kinase [Pseudoduganella sp.]|jgi:signal transduction histidine kinase/DNA-binding response OmpR family regulator|nr:histidine kinase [Pseudoduganella sp.]